MDKEKGSCKYFGGKKIKVKENVDPLVNGGTSGREY